MDSLGIVEIRNALNMRVAIEVTPTTIIDYPTIIALSRYLADGSDGFCDTSGVRDMETRSSPRSNVEGASLPPLKISVVWLCILRLLIKFFNICGIATSYACGLDVLRCTLRTLTAPQYAFLPLLPHYQLHRTRCRPSIHLNQCLWNDGISKMCKGRRQSHTKHVLDAFLQMLMYLMPLPSQFLGTFEIRLLLFCLIFTSTIDHVIYRLLYISQ